MTMRLLLLSGLLSLALADEEGLICSSWMKRFAADPALGENMYWECPGEGERAVLKKCPEGMIYKPKGGRCRRAPPRVLKRADGQPTPQNLELLDMEGIVSNQGLGILYNARTEQFLPGTYLWSRSKMDEVKVVEEQVYSNLDVYQENDFNDRAYNLNVEASLTLGFLSGLIKVSGSAKYLNDRKESSNIARVTMSYKSTTRAETIPLSTPIEGRYVRNCEKAQTEQGATHVVTSIVYGLRAFLRFDKEASSSESVEQISGDLSVEINSIPGFKFNGKAWIDIDGKEVKSDDSLKVMYHGDTTVSTPTSYLSAIQAFNEVQEQGPTGNAPIRYQLAPLSYLCTNDVFALKEIGDNLVNEAIKALTELEQTKLETSTLLNTDVAYKIPQVKRVLDKFEKELISFETNFKYDIQQQLKDLRAGKGNEESFTKLIQEYQNSAFFYDKAHAFLEQRKRVISTINLIIEEAKKNTAPGGRVIFTVVDVQTAEDTSCLIESDYSYVFGINLLSSKKIAEDFIKTKQLVDESDQWYNDLDKVGEVGGRLKDFIQFGLASWPDVVSDPIKHCFLIKLNEVNDESDKYLDIEYSYAEGGYNPVFGNGFIPPPTPPKPVCHPKYDGFDLDTQGTDNKFVKKHWIEATTGDNKEVSTDNQGNVNSITINGLSSNTAYNITTKFKVLDGESKRLEDLGFSPKSEVVTCVTAPTTPVRNLAVSAVTSSSMTIGWTKPAKPTSGANSDIKYVLKVRKEGASDAESIIEVKEYTETGHQVSGLDPATLYDILIYTKTDISASEPVKIQQSTAPESIPFPEVNTVSETSVTLIEKISLVELPSDLRTDKLIVRYVEVNELDGSAVGAEKTMNVALNGAKGDKRFTISGLVGGKSYGITVVLQVQYRGRKMPSASTDRLIITTPFGGSETDKVKSQFDKIKHNTDSRINSIDSAVDGQKRKLDGLSGQVDGIINEANQKIAALEAAAMANITSQQTILSGIAKRSCIETGINYYTGSVIAKPRTNSIFHCLSECRKKAGCNGASWNTKTTFCSMSSQRRGSQPSIDKQIVSINRVCYDTLTGEAAKWKSCIKERTDYGGADISGAQSLGFGTEWDCMAWCINTATCKSITYRASDGHCWLKHKPYGDRQSGNAALTSISLECMQS